MLIDLDSPVAIIYVSRLAIKQSIGMLWDFSVLRMEFCGKNWPPKCYVLFYWIIYVRHMSQLASFELVFAKDHRSSTD